MVILSEGARNAQFIVSEANAYRSRATAVVSVPLGGLEAGTVLGLITSSGKYVRHDSALSNGAETAVAILYENLPDAGNTDATLFVRDAEVTGAHLIYEDGADASAITASDAGLAAVGLIVR